MLTAQHIAMAAGREMQSAFVQSQQSRADETPDFLHLIADGGPSATLSLRACPGTIERFAQGVYSHPLSWWAGIHQLAGMAGLYGERNRRTAQIRSSILSQILHAALNHPRQAVAIIRWYVEHHLRNNTAGVLGRLLGGAFTNYATRGGASIPFRARVAMGIGNFLLASYGAAMIGIEQGRHEVGDIIGMILTGDYQLRVCAPSDAPPAEIELQSLTEQDLFLLEYIEEIYHLNTNDNFRSEHFSYRDLPVR